MDSGVAELQKKLDQALIETKNNEAEYESTKG
jgi:hypothetical protein